MNSSLSSTTSSLSSEAAAIKVGNRFTLVLMATQRAKQIAKGSVTKLTEKNLSPISAALREIEQGLFTEKDFIKNLPSKKPTKYHENYSS